MNLVVNDSNIKWVFLIQDSIQDCIRKWWCNHYYDLYNQSDEIEKEVHNHNACEKLFKQHMQVWVIWCTEVVAERSNDS